MAISLKDQNKNYIPTTKYPNLLVSDEEKATDAFGLSVALSIQSEWFDKGDDRQCSFYSNSGRYDMLRRYARGEHSTKEIAELIGVTEGEDSYTNYNLDPIQVMPKFVNLVVNQMSERLFSVKAEANDKYSSAMRDSRRKNLERFVASMPIMAEVKKQLGVDIAPDNASEMPQTQEEVNLHMQMNDKTAIEIMAESAIKFTLDTNDYPDIQNQLIEDTTVIGIAAMKRFTDPQKGIQVKYLDPADMVYSYAKSKNFKNVHYFGEVERITISELKRRTGNKFSIKELEEFAANTADWATYHNVDTNQFTYRDEDINNNMVDILNFSFKALNRVNYKKKFSKNGGFKMAKKESTFAKKNKDYSGYDVVGKDIDVWYSGSLVLGTQNIFNYKLNENMVRKGGYLNNTAPEYIVHSHEMYKGRTNSLVSRTTSYIDILQQIHIKIQQMVAKARPNGVYFDIDGLSEVDLGDGNFLTPMEVMKIYDETGNVIGTSKTAEGDYNYGKSPIVELKNGIIDGIDRLIGVYNHYLNMLREAIGIPVGVDASSPHPKMLVGVQQQMALSSNVATRHILESILIMTEELGEGITMSLGDILKHPNLRQAYVNAIGKLNVETIKELENYSMFDLGFRIELKPDAEEKQYLEQNIQASLERNLITFDEAQTIRTTGNIKLSNQLLKVTRQKREKLEQERKKELIDAQAKGGQQSAQIAAQAKQQEIQAQSQADMQLTGAKSKGKIEEIKAEEESKARLMEKEFQYNMELQGLSVDADQTRARKAEDRKDQRQDRNNTQRSAMDSEKSTEGKTKALDFNSQNVRGSVNLDMGV